MNAYYNGDEFQRNIFHKHMTFMENMCCGFYKRYTAPLRTANDNNQVLDELYSRVIIFKTEVNVDACMLPAIRTTLQTKLNFAHLKTVPLLHHRVLPRLEFSALEKETFRIDFQCTFLTDFLSSRTLAVISTYL